MPYNREMHLPDLASNRAVVLSNIYRFEDEVRRTPGLADRLARFRAWYAAEGEDKQWRFGPSKFVGYEGLDGEEYLNLSRQKLIDGRVTEQHLQDRQWFKEVNPGCQMYDLLAAKLSVFLRQYGKTPNRKMRISIEKS